MGTMNGSTNGSNGQKQPDGAATLTTAPFPASRKIHVNGAHPGVRVPMREISLSPTKSMNGGAPVPNEPITIYDTSDSTQVMSRVLEALDAGVPPGNVHEERFTW